VYYELIGTCVRIAGTLHMLPAGFPELPNWVGRSYGWAQDLWLEHDVTQLRWHAYLPKGTTLEQKLGADIWARLRAIWPQDSPLGDLSTLKPGIALVGLPFVDRAMAPGVEPYVTQRATADSKPIHYLETMAELSEIGDAIPDATYVEAIQRVLSNNVLLPGCADARIQCLAERAAQGT
jgi:uncharacterized protein